MTWTLMLMRHAKSDHGDRSLSDHDRPLNKRGRHDSPRMADWMVDQGSVPQRVLCSTAERTRETLQLMLPRWPAEPEIEFCESLYLASAEAILWTIGSQHGGVSSLLVLGHNPGISMVASVLGGQRIELPTAAIAVLTADDEQEVGDGSPFAAIGVGTPLALRQWITPKTLD
jgi:phosphohistidine phosphatase